MRIVCRCHIFLVLCFTSMAHAQGQFSVGFAELEITPQVGEEFLLVGGGRGEITEIGDPLFVQAAVLSDSSTKFALVSVDAIDLRSKDFAFIEQKLKDSGFDHVVLAVTHSHGAFMTGNQLDAVVAKVLTAVEVAAESPQPVKLAAGKVQVDEAYNRRVIKADGVEMLWTNPHRQPGRPVDQALRFVHLVNQKGDSVLTLLNYSAHPVISMDLNRAIVSADYPGALRRKVEEELGGNAMFFMGASGDVNPYHANTVPYEEAKEEMNGMAKTLSQAAIKNIGMLDDYRAEGRFKFDTIVFDGPRAQVTVALLTPDIALAGFPGEYFDTLGQELQAGSPADTTFFIGKSNGDLRYVPTQEDAEKGGFGADPETTRVKPGTGEHHIREAVKRLRMLAQSIEVDKN